MLLRIVIYLAIGYVVIILLLMALENWMVYHPTPASQDWLRPPAGVMDVELQLADGTPIHGWWFPHEGAKGALLYLHGNAGNLSHRRDTVAQMRRVLNENILIIDYPGYGKSGGSPSEAGCYESAEAAYKWLTEEKKVPGERVILFGGSLGSGVAVELASRHKHRALLLLSPFTSLPDVGASIYPWLPVRWLMRNRFDSLSRIASCTRPIFIVHGTADNVVPFHLGQKLFEAVQGPKQFVRVPGGGHNDGMGDAMLEQFVAFLKRSESSGK
jgi:hypothetical protein